MVETVLIIYISKVSVFFTFTFCQTNPVTNVDLSVLLSERKRKEEERVLSLLCVGHGNRNMQWKMLYYK